MLSTERLQELHRLAALHNTGSTDAQSQLCQAIAELIAEVHRLRQMHQAEVDVITRLTVAVALLVSAVKGDK